MDAILLDMAKIPPHAPAPYAPIASPIVRIAEWPAGTFVENLCCLPDGDIVVSVLSEARLDRVTLAGAIRPLRQLSAPPTGLALDGDSVLVCVGEPGAAGHAIWRLDTATGAGEIAIPMPDARFLNGITWLAPGVLLAADSALGCLFRIELPTGEVTRWVSDERLTQAPGVPELPGANGVKRFGNAVTITSNGRALVLQVPMLADGTAGPMTVLATDLRADDIAFDAEGNLYLTTHIGGTLDRLTPAGDRTTLAGPDQGLAGSTACAFGVKPGSETHLFVTTTGGIVNPRGGTLQPARLIRLDLDTAGYPIAPGGQSAP